MELLCCNKQYLLSVKRPSLLINPRDRLRLSVMHSVKPYHWNRVRCRFDVDLFLFFGDASQNFSWFKFDLLLLPDYFCCDIYLSFFDICLVQVQTTGKGDFSVFYTWLMTNTVSGVIDKVFQVTALMVGICSHL